MPRITLLTDFGTADGYVAAMKGVIAALAPDALIDDATHEIPPGDIAAAAWAIGNYWRLYPPGTVHVAVVDPGVGGQRRALAVRAEDRFLVAPDNGLLTRILADGHAEAVVSVENPELLRHPVSATFHGRDVFAPAAARLVAGMPLDDCGPAVRDPVRLELPRAIRDGKRVRGEVVHVDRFGNLVTNVPGVWLDTGLVVRLAGLDVGPLRRTYPDVERGQPLAVVGSAGYLEISVRDGSAMALLGASRGAAVEVLPASGQSQQDETGQ